MPDNIWAAALFSVTPTIVVGLIFWFIVRAIIRADRTERAVFERIDAEERAAAAAEVETAPGSASTPRRDA